MRMKLICISLSISLVISFIVVAILFNRLSILKADYAWLQNTYETNIIGAYQTNGMLAACKEHLEGYPKEYILDSSPSTMDLPIENFYSYKSDGTWHTELQIRWLEVFVKEHNSTLARLISESKKR